MRSLVHGRGLDGSANLKNDAGEERRIFFVKMRSKIQGVAKKRSPLQKWLTWFIMTINKENVNKSCVFVLA